MFRLKNEKINVYIKMHIMRSEYIVFVCLFDLILFAQVSNFSLMSRRGFLA